MLAPAPVLAMGFLGQEDSIEVSAAGRALMSIAEITKAAALLVPAAMVAGWSPGRGHGGSLAPFAAAAGAGALAAAAVAAWFAHPGTLNGAFDHQRLVLTRETLALVRRLGCFWLSLLVSALDYFGLLLWGALVLGTHDLQARGRAGPPHARSAEGGRVSMHTCVCVCVCVLGGKGRCQLSQLVSALDYFGLLLWAALVLGTHDLQARWASPAVL